MSRNLDGSLKYKAYSFLNNLKDAVFPVQKKSRFKEQRTLTPDEFVKAGDYLVDAYPLWKWSSGLADKKKDYLPPEKQYLIIKQIPTRPVLCNNEDIDETEDDGWVCPGTTSTKELPEIGDEGNDITDISDAAEDDPSALPAEPSNRRLYDLHITYDKLLSVPRFWLVGYSSSGAMLSSEEISEDISKEHAGMTLTLDQHPHEKLRAVSIHPCKHAAVMKELMDSMESNGQQVIVDHYLLVFLKFLVALVPTIDFDYGEYSIGQKS